MNNERVRRCVQKLSGPLMGLAILSGFADVGILGYKFYESTQSRAEAIKAIGYSPREIELAELFRDSVRKEIIASANSHRFDSVAASLSPDVIRTQRMIDDVNNKQQEISRENRLPEKVVFAMFLVPLGAFAGRVGTEAFLGKRSS